LQDNISILKGEKMNQLIIQPIIRNLENYLDFADENSMDFEIIDFCEYKNMSNVRKFYEITEIYRPFRNRIYSLHGIFEGIQIACNDLKIRNDSRKKIDASCHISALYNIKNVVVHCDKLPYLFQNPGTDNWLNICYEFYSEMLDEHKKINIIIEDCWDIDPYPMKQLIEKMNTYRFKGGINTNYVNRYSKLNIGEWIDVLKKDLVCFHYSDDQREFGGYDPAAQGIRNFKTLTSRVKKYNIKPAVVFETFSVYDIKSSISYLKENGFYPFNKSAEPKIRQMK
jgi:hypothetical protein